MPEVIKTVIFTSVAVVLLAAAWVTWPRVAPPTVDDTINKPLFDEFETADAKRLEILRYDTNAENLEEFSVKQTEYGWVIPSKENYQADATDQMQKAANLLANMVVIQVATDSSDDHELYGVIEPKEGETKLGQEGVGTLVNLKGDNDSSLASAIIGKRVKNQEQNRFVRLPNQNRVYVCEVDLEILSTDFKDWIEKDLLRLNKWDIQGLTLKEYQTDLFKVSPTQLQAVPNKKFDVNLKFDGTKWGLDKLVEYKAKEGEAPVGTEYKMTENEELNLERLDTLVTELNQVQLTDVERKPSGLKADLTADMEFLQKRENQISVQSHGFYLFPTKEGRFEVLSENGDMIISMKNGVEYLVRFGRMEVESSIDEEEQKAKFNRYMMVSAQVNESVFPMPVKEQLPTAKPTGNEDAPPAPADDKKAKDADKDCFAQDDAPVDDKLEAEKERIERAYQRKLKVRDDQIKKAQEEVKTLNARFGEWYYVIDEDSFTKLRITREELIKTKVAPLSAPAGLGGIPPMKKPNPGDGGTSKKAPAPKTNDKSNGKSEAVQAPAGGVKPDPNKKPEAAKSESPAKKEPAAKADKPAATKDATKKESPKADAKKADTKKESPKLDAKKSDDKSK